MGKQVGCAALSMLGAHSHADPGSGGQLDPEMALNPPLEVDFGDGSDGDVDINVGTTLTRDMSYNNLHLIAGNLYANGFKIRVRGKLTIDPGRYVQALDGAINPNGANGAGGVGGAAGAAAFATRRPATCLSTAGSRGGDGGAAGNVAEAGALLTNTLFNGVVGLDVSGFFEGRLWAGAGGGGGGQVGDNGDPGYINPVQALPVLAGARGGKGGDALWTGAALYELGGGGGGGGGGKIEIWVNEIDNNGIISSNGGDGGAGQVGVAGTDEAGGGGGGGGGAILIFYKVLSGGGLGVRSVAGGLAGANGDPAGLATAGAAGFSYAMKIGS